MYKGIVAALVLVLSAACSYAQVGEYVIGTGTQVGAGVIAPKSTIGQGTVAAGVLCSSSCIEPPPCVTGLYLGARRHQRNFVLLNWYTLTEYNNKSFYIERTCTAGTAFETVGHVAAIGYSSKRTNYEFTDTNTYTGITYYRIRQQGVNGDTSFSNTVPVAGVDNGICIYPNPAHTYCNIRLPESFSLETVTVTLFDAAGKLVYKNCFANGKGGVITLNNLARLKPGIYMVAVSNSTQKAYGKLVISCN